MALQKRPYSAVSVMIDQMTNASVPENDLGGLPELVDVVNIQDTGPSEAARALRKKLKYGSVHRQLRALTILDALIENAGPQFKRSFADEPLLERLRFCASAPTSDPEVRKKCDELFRGWASMYKNTRGMERVTTLYKVGQPVQSSSSLSMGARERLDLSRPKGPANNHVSSSMSSSISLPPC